AVFYAGGCETREDLGELAAPVSDAGQVRHRFDAGFALDRGGQLDGELARRAARAVGDRHESGLQLGELLQRRVELGDAVLTLRREELEGEARRTRAKSLGDAHGET